jgi:nitrogenase molybdenum-iron protein beta chain
MALLLDQPRYKCALSAMQTVQAIEGAIPILHSGPGCGAKLNDNDGVSGHYSYHIYPCSSLSEKEVIFGGEPRLEETIASALDIIDADLFVVMTGCTSEIIGDDVASVTTGFSSAKKRVVFAHTPGFAGSNYQGHDWVLKAIFEQYLDEVESPPREEGLVNIFAGPPAQDPFWLGNLRVLEELVRAIGLSPNTIFGHNRGLERVRRLPHAQFNLLVSPWVGLESARYLSERFGAPLLHYPVLPIGAFETTRFLRTLADFTGADPERVEQVIRDNEAEYYYYIERFADTFLELRIVSKRFVVVADAQYTLALTRFLVNDLGKFPTQQFITDATPEEYQQAVADLLQELNYGIRAAVSFSVNGSDIHDQIAAADFGGPPLILGSSYEKILAERLGGHFINVSYPVKERLIMNSALAGYSGGLKLLEDIYTAALTQLAL